MQSESQKLWFCLAGFDPFHLFCLVSLVTVLQYVRWWIVFVCSVEEKKGEQEGVCFSSSCTWPPIRHRIWDLWADREGNFKTQVSPLSNHFSSFRPTSSLVFILSLLQLEVQAPAAVRSRQYLPHVCLLRLSSTASHSCPSHQSTPGSCRQSGSSHWLHGCYGHHKHGWEPVENADNSISLSLFFQ